MKKFILGFFVGSLLFTTVPVQAALQDYIAHKADYKVMVNGKEYVNPDLPILNYKGNTYAPFRSILESAGLNVNWDAELNQAEVTAQGPITKTTKGGVAILEVKNARINNSESVFKYIIKDGENFIPFNALPEGVKYEHSPNWVQDKEDKDLKIIVSIPGKPGYSGIKSKIIAGEDQNAMEYAGRMYVKVSSLGLTARLDGDTLWLK